MRVTRNDDGTSNAADVAEFSGGRVYDCGFGDVCVDYHQTVTRSRPGDWVVCDDDGCMIVSDEEVQKNYTFQDDAPAAEKTSAKDDAETETGKTLRKDESDADAKTKLKESEAKVSGGEKKREEFAPGGAANQQNVRGATQERTASTPAQREQDRRAFDEKKR